MGNEVVDYYNSIAEDYDESRFGNSYGRFIDAEERRILDKIIDLNADDKRLEMACGTGRLTNYATHGLDASEKMIAHAKERHPGVEFREASACDTGYADGLFDLVYTFHFLMHIDEQTVRQVFDEVYRVLRPGGRFIFDIPSKKRRKLLHHKQTSWHGATAMDKADVESLAADRFKLNRTFGIMLLPVHKLPVRLRKPLTRMDYALANSFMRQYSSYQVYELIKL
jgi:ubiquinone/menaquinone biosynthesis C-methylase UbiE